MATLTNGYTFGATETVTAAKLHLLVTGGTCTDIVAADITNDTITTTQIGELDCSKVIGLGNMPMGAGYLPSANLSQVSGTTFFNLSGIPASAGEIPLSATPTIVNAKLSPITTVNLVGGTSLSNLAGIPSGAGVIPVANLGTGTPSSSNYLRGDGSFQVVSDISYSAGDVLILSANTERTTTLTTPTLKKSIVTGLGGTLRIKYDFNGTTLGAYANIYRNGVAVGTERTDSSGTYSTYTEDISGWLRGDEVQIYLWAVSGETASVRNFRIYVATAVGGNVKTD